MDDFILNDRYFDPEASRLSSHFSQIFILPGPASFQYAILDTEKNMFVGLADYRLPKNTENSWQYTARLNRIFSSDPFLQKKYPAVIFGINSPYHILVPAELYDAGKATSLLELHFRLPENIIAATDRLEEVGAYHVFGNEDVIQGFIRDKAADSLIVHRSTALIKAVNLLHRQLNDPVSVYLNLNENQLDIVFFRNGKLEFFNSFPYREKEDILYFTLYTLEQLDLRPDGIKLILSGGLLGETDTEALLRQYIRTVTFTGPMPGFGFHNIFKPAPLYRYFQLFALALCGS